MEKHSAILESNGQVVNRVGGNGVIKSPVISRLRLITYLCPSMPLELYQIYQHYFEESLGCETILCVESRWSAPPADKNPFYTDAVDIGFACSTGFVTMNLHEKKNPHVALLPLAPLYDHPLANDRPVYFSEVIIRKETVSRFKTVEDLRGFTFAVNDMLSMSGSFSMKSELKKMGADGSFFGSILTSGSHRESIKMVLNGTADAAAIDSNVWKYWKKENNELAEKLDILCSWGPYPVQPIFINTRLSGEVKRAIEAALIKAHQHPVYREKFLKFGLKGFARIDESAFDLTVEVMDVAKGLNLTPRYY